MPIRRTTLCIAALMMSALPALATGGFGCEAADKNVKLEANAGMQRGGAGALLNFKAEIESLLKNTPEDFRKLSLDREAISQHWIDGRDFKLRLYTERTQGLFGALELVIEAVQRSKDKDEGTYKGRYTLTIENMETEQSSEAKTLKASGNIVCFVE
ncbi:MAG TPA: hypothetical protein VNR41_14770 [Xanthobacteraceae bacterium]|jgi:hypothetical protein|nr:hypothetical protein [Xanthobacteraceae bacterium]